MCSDILEYIFNRDFLIKRFVDFGHFQDIVIIVLIKMWRNNLRFKVFYANFQFILHVVKLIVVVKAM